MTARAASDVVQDETLRRMAAADNYNAWLLDRSRRYLGRRVLDVGAGIGTFTEMVAPGRHVTAAEPDPAFASVLRRRFANAPNVRIVEAEADTLEPGLVSDSFDSVICFNVLEHIPDDLEALRRFRQQLAPEGRLLLLVPAHPLLYGPVDRELGHHRRYRKDALRRLLVQAGFTIETLRYVNPIGALGWLVSARLFRRRGVPAGPLRLFDRLVPLFRGLDRFEVPFGLSLWAVGCRCEADGHDDVAS